MGKRSHCFQANLAAIGDYSFQLAFADEDDNDEIGVYGCATLRDKDGTPLSLEQYRARAPKCNVKW